MLAYIDNHDISLDEMMKYIKGPDFPTGAIILGNSGIRKAYETGRGVITVRSKAQIEEEKGRNVIIIMKFLMVSIPQSLKIRLLSWYIIRSLMVSPISRVNQIRWYPNRLH